MESQSLDLLICVACGTQFDVHVDQPLEGCRICDDPRQYVPPTGQAWTSLRKAQQGEHRNIIEPVATYRNSNSMSTRPASPDSLTKLVPEVYSVFTTPKLGIGERAILLKTPHGNILWDLIAYLDQGTIDEIKSMGGLRAIVISHPHYYTTHLEWAKAFDCPVYVAKEDEEWLSRSDDLSARRVIEQQTEEIVPGVTAIKVGGHFPGSLVMHWRDMLFLADSVVTLPSALYQVNRPKGTTSYSFMWSIPNMIPLPPSELLKMWKAIKPFNFVQTHGAFAGQDIYDPNVKGRLLASMQIQARGATGSEQHEIMKETPEVRR